MIQALNYTDFLCRPHRPEELQNEDGGGVVFSLAAHQVDMVRLLAGSRATRVRAVMGRWDPARPTEGAYRSLLWYEDGAFAFLTYSGYGRFDGDEWCGWTGEMGHAKSPETHGQARRLLGGVAFNEEEARLKAAGTYGGPAWEPPVPAEAAAAVAMHQHFGPVIVSCEHGYLRPMPDAAGVYGDSKCERIELPPPAVPCFKVIDKLAKAVLNGCKPLDDGPSAGAAREVCLALLRSAREGRDVELSHQVALRE